jgi:hypothetical protein
MVSIEAIAHMNATRLAARLGAPRSARPDVEQVTTTPAPHPAR